MVPLLRRCEYLGEVIDGAPHAVNFSYFRVLDYEHSADNLSGCRDIE
jgi:hypothetical protein